MTSLEEKFAKRPKKGTLQNRTALMQALLNESNGRLLMVSVAKLGRHVAQLVIEIQKTEHSLVSSYDKAVPVFGISSVLARKKANEIKGSKFDINGDKNATEE